MAKQTGLAGALAQIATSATDSKTAASTIEGRNSWTLDLDKDVVNLPDFNDANSYNGFQKKYIGLKNATGSLDGYIDPAGTVLKELLNAYINDTKKGLKLWLDDSHYIYAEAYITAISFDTPLEDAETLSADFEVDKEPLLTTAFD